MAFTSTFTINALEFVQHILELEVAFKFKAVVFIMGDWFVSQFKQYQNANEKQTLKMEWDKFDVLDRQNEIHFE